jgi:capsid protein
VIWPAYRKRFHQTRGVPFLAVILATFDRTNNYLDYESLAAEGDAMRGYQITREPDDTAAAGEDDNDDPNSPYKKLQKMEPFMIFDLRPGEEVKSFVDGRPGSNFESYLITCCRIIGVGVGYPLELLLLDFSRTNYSSARASLLEGRRMFRTWQKFSGSHICLPWHRWQIDRGIAAGKLPADPRLYLTRCQWPAWEAIDKVKEAQGDQIGISYAGRSISEGIRERGRDPKEVYDELAWDIKELEKRGITLDVSSLRINTVLITGEQESERTEDKK